MRIFLPVMALFLVFTFVYLEVEFAVTDKQEYLLCKTPMFLLLRSTGELTTIIFAICGILITRSVLKGHQVTPYDQSNK